MSNVGTHINHFLPALTCSSGYSPRYEYGIIKNNAGPKAPPCSLPDSSTWLPSAEETHRVPVRTGHSTFLEDMQANCSFYLEGCFKTTAPCSWYMFVLCSTRTQHVNQLCWFTDSYLGLGIESHELIGAENNIYIYMYTCICTHTGCSIT